MNSLSREHLTELLGLTCAAPAGWTVVSEAVEDDLCIKRVYLAQSGIPGITLAPVGLPAKAPAVLYCHAHGNAFGIGKSEVLVGRPALIEPPLAREIAQSGALVVCIDLAGFGEREAEGTETALSKAALWHGQTLLGRMVRDQVQALDTLIALQAPSRIATVGISMGGTLSYLLAALREDIAASAHLCVFSDIAPLIETGAHDLHGPYMTIPSLLPKHDMGDIAALVAPRPQFVATGATDPLTPDSAYSPALARLEHAYRSAPDNLTIVREQLSGHVETPGIRQALIRFLVRQLDPPPRPD